MNDRERGRKDRRRRGGEEVGRKEGRKEGRNGEPPLKARKFTLHLDCGTFGLLIASTIHIYVNTPSLHLL